VVYRVLEGPMVVDSVVQCVGAGVDAPFPSPVEEGVCMIPGCELLLQSGAVVFSVERMYGLHP